MKLDDLLAGVPTEAEIEARARELHDIDAPLWPPPHGTWDDCNETHRDRYRDLAKRELSSR